MTKTEISFAKPDPIKMRVRFVRNDSRNKRMTYVVDPHGVEVTLQGATVIEQPTHIEALCEARDMPRGRSTQVTEPAHHGGQGGLTPAEWTQCFDVAMANAEKRYQDFVAKVGTEAMDPGLHSDCYMWCDAGDDGALTLKVVNRDGQIAYAVLPSGEAREQGGFAAGARGTVTVLVEPTEDGYPEAVAVGEFHPCSESAWFHAQNHLTALRGSKSGSSQAS